MNKIRDEILEFIGEHRIQTICDYGCGGGELLQAIHDHSPVKLALTGVDYLSQLRGEHRPKAGDHIRFVDKASAEFSGLASKPGFDLVISTHALHHFQRPVAELQTIQVLINPDGYLFLTDFDFQNDTPGEIVKNLYTYFEERYFAFQGKHHRHHYTLQEALDLLRGTSLRVLEAEERRRPRLETDRLDELKDMMERVRRLAGLMERDSLPPPLKDHFGRELLMIKELLERDGSEHSAYFKIVCQK